VSESNRALAPAVGPWVALAVCLGAAVVLNPAALEAADQLGLGRWALMGAALAAALACSAFVSFGLWSSERRIAIASLPAALPWLMSLGVLRAHMSQAPYNLWEETGDGAVAALTLVEAAQGAFFGALLSAALFFGLTATAFGTKTKGTAAAALGAVTLGWLAAATALWHGVVAEAFGWVPGPSDGSGELFDAARAVISIEWGGLLGAVVIASIGALLVVWRDRRRALLPLAALAYGGALVAATHTAHEVSLAEAGERLHRPWNAPSFEPVAVGELTVAYGRPLGVIGPGGLELLALPGEDPPTTLRALLEDRAELRRAAAPDPDPVPDWLLEEPREAAPREPSRTPSGPDPALVELQEMAARMEEARLPVAPLCALSNGDTVTLALDARADAAALRKAIEALHEANAPTLELAGPMTELPEALHAVPLATPLIAARAWGLRVHVPSSCANPTTPFFFHGSIGAQPLDELERLDERIPIAGDGLEEWFSSSPAGEPVVLALTDDATPAALVGTLEAIAAWPSPVEVVLFSSAAAVPEAEVPQVDSGGLRSGAAAEEDADRERGEHEGRGGEADEHRYRRGAGEGDLPEGDREGREERAEPAAEAGREAAELHPHERDVHGDQRDREGAGPEGAEEHGEPPLVGEAAVETDQFGETLEGLGAGGEGDQDPDRDHRSEQRAACPAAQGLVSRLHGWSLAFPAARGQVGRSSHACRSSAARGPRALATGVSWADPSKVRVLSQGATVR
jgi:hypothetical protein